MFQAAEKKNLEKRALLNKMPFNVASVDEMAHMAGIRSFPGWFVLRIDFHGS